MFPLRYWDIFVWNIVVWIFPSHTRSQSILSLSFIFLVLSRHLVYWLKAGVEEVPQVLCYTFPYVPSNLACLFHCVAVFSFPFPSIVCMYPINVCIYFLLLSLSSGSSQVSSCNRRIFAVRFNQ